MSAVSTSQEQAPLTGAPAAPRWTWRAAVVRAAAVILAAGLAIGTGVLGASTLGARGAGATEPADAPSGTGVITPAGAVPIGQTTPLDATLTAAKAPTCSLVTPTEVKNALNLAVGRPKTQHSGNVTACFYPYQGDARGVTIRFQTQATKVQFAAARRQFQKHDGQTTTVTTLADQAYSAVIPAGPPTQYTVYAIAVLHNSTALLVTAVNPVPLTAEEALAKKILPSL